MKQLLAANTVLALAGILAGCANHKSTLPEMPQAEPAQVNLAGRSPKVVNLETLRLDIPAGTHIGEARSGWSNSCTNPTPLTYKHGLVKLAKASYEGVFREVMQEAGVPVEEVPRFAGEEVRKADLNIAATIKEMLVNICFPNVGRDKNHAIGEAYVSVEWSVFSPLERKVVYAGITKGRTPQKFETRLADDGLIGEAMRQSLRKALNEPEFVSALTSKREGETAGAALPKMPPLTGALSKNMAQVRSAVVSVFANAGQGSGFAVGRGDHVLTSAHVVSGSKFVKLTTADGQQYYGEVVQTNAARDLALIKLDRGQLKALRIAQSVPTMGAEVYAIGSPLGEKFALSVTKGVVSGLRREDGLDYLQSDVNVLPGSSGGPLLDVNGNVVGVTRGGVVFAGAPVGMNFFTPAAELQEFLQEKR